MHQLNRVVVGRALIIGRIGALRNLRLRKFREMFQMKKISDLAVMTSVSAGPSCSTCVRLCMTPNRVCK